MAEERYLLQLIEEIISKKIHQPSQFGHKTILKADNGEFMDLLIASNIDNVSKSRVTWSKSEEFIDALTKKHDPFVPKPPKKPAATPPSPLIP